MNSVLPLTIYAILMAGHFAAEPARWRLLFWDSCSWRLPKWFHLHNVTALLSYLLPAKLGIPLRLGLIKQQTQLAMNTVLAGLGMDAVIYYVTWALVTVTLVICSPGLRTRVDSANPVVLLVVTSLVLTLGLLLRRAGGRRDRAAPGKSEAGLAGLRTALGAVNDMPRRRLALVLGLVLTDILAEGVRQTCLATALGIPVPMSTMMLVGIVGFAAGLFSFMPMGLGAYDAAVILLLAGSGVQPTQLVGLLAGNRLALIAFSAVLGSIGAVQLGLRPAQLKAFRELVLRRNPAPHPDLTDN